MKQRKFSNLLGKGRLLHVLSGVSITAVTLLGISGPANAACTGLNTANVSCTGTDSTVGASAFGGNVSNTLTDWTLTGAGFRSSVTGAFSNTLIATGINITTNAHAINLSSGSGNVTATIVSGTIQTTGTSHHGINAASSGAGLITIANSGIIGTSGTTSYAIRAVATNGGSIDITNNGTLTATGLDGWGIRADSTGSASFSPVLNVVSHGNVTASGHAVYAKADNGGSVVVRASGDLTMTGNVTSATTSYRGISAYSTGTGAGNFATAYYEGGTIRGLGTNNTNGLYGATVGGDARVEAAAGTYIYTTIHGVFGRSGNTAGYAYTSDAGGNVTILFDGERIETTADGFASIWGGAVGVKHAGNADSSNVFISNDHATLVATGNGGAGIHGRSQAGDVTIFNGGDIFTSGSSLAANSNYTDRAAGLYGQADVGSIRIENTGAITTSGDGAAGILADGRNTSSASGGGSISVHNTGKIETSGSISGDYFIAADGIFARSNGGAVSIVNDGDITIHGAHSRGIFAGNTVNAATITITNNSTITHDSATADQYGIEVMSGSDTSVTINHSGTITGSWFGIVAWNQGLAETGSSATINIGSQGVIDTRTGSAGIIADMDVANTINIAAGGLIDAGAQGIVLRYNGVNARTDSVNNAGTILSLTDTIAEARFTNAGPVALTVNNLASGQMTGNILASEAKVTIANDGLWNLRSFADTDGDQIRDHLSVALSDLGTSGANLVKNSGTIALLGKGDATAQTLDTTGMYVPFGYSINTMSLNSPAQGQLMGVTTFENSGVIDLTANVENGVSVVGDVLVISGGQVAGTDGGGVFVANGGTLKVNTVLNEGGANSQSDILVVDSTRLGSAPTLINVASAGGNGAITLGNGIALVEVLNKAQSANGVFMLGQRIAAGAYDYQLFHNGVGNDADDGNWYLRNTYVAPPSPPGCEDTDSCNPVTPVPIIRDEVAVSMAIPPLAIEYGYAMLDTLHERVGETYLHNAAPVTEERVVWCKDASQNFKCTVRVPVANANGTAKDETRWASSGWARLIGNRGLHQPDNFQRRGANYDYDFGGIQAGLDIYAREQADGTLDKMGLYVGYGQIRSNVKGQLGGKAGSVDMDAYTLGGYWTHLSAQGWYTDAVIQGTWYAADATSVHGQRIKPDGFGILASLEGGYSFKLGSGWSLEPQAQIVYQNVSFDNTRDAYGFVSFADGDSLRGRLGLRLAKSWDQAREGNAPRLITAWLRGNIWHEFLGKTKTAWGSLDGQNMTPFNSYLGGTWGEIGAGVTAQVSDKVNLFATGAYNRSLDNKGHQGWDGRLGMTVKW